MNRTQKFGIALMVIGALTPFVIESVLAIRLRKTIAEIDAEHEAQMQAMAKAKAIVMKLVANNYYENRSYEDVENDYYFYMIAARYND